MSKLEQMRHAILAARDFRRKAVAVPEWGCESGLFVRSLSILDAVAFEALSKDTDDAKYSALYLAYSLCDESGERIFDPNNDVDALCGKDPDIVSRLFNEAVFMNGGGKDAEKEREEKS